MHSPISSFLWEERSSLLTRPELFVPRKSNRKHDPETPLPCSEELKRGILGSRMVVLEKTGHRPFVEERTLFIHTVQEFLNR